MNISTLWNLLGGALLVGCAAFVVLLATLIGWML